MATEHELEAFRQQWREEINFRGAAAQVDTAGATPVRPAIDWYRLAVEYEQRGMLEDALRLYQKSFRMDPHIDVAYHNLVSSGQVSQVQTTSGHAAPVAEPNVPFLPTTISAIVDGLQGQPLLCEPLDDQLPVLLAEIPQEVVVHAFCALARDGDVTSIERAALANRKLRMLTLDPTIWRTLVEATYVYPQVSGPRELQQLVKSHRLDYRTLYTESPRVRLDGVYISVCYYVRHGLSENLWYNPRHLVTYHRYLRFLPDGHVLSVLSSGGSAPADMVQQLKATSRFQGLSIGTWLVNGPMVEVKDLANADGKANKYTFQMKLVLKHRGRWNKLDFVEYKSLHIATGCVDALPLRHERPFHFSKVKSYGLPLALGNVPVAT